MVDRRELIGNSFLHFFPVVFSGFDNSKEIKLFFVQTFNDEHIKNVTKSLNFHYDKTQVILLRQSNSI